MKRKVLKVLALTGFLTFGLVGASCGEDTPVVTDETTSNICTEQHNRQNRLSLIKDTPNNHTITGRDSKDNKETT